jgi:hypothetical protein
VKVRLCASLEQSWAIAKTHLKSKKTKKKEKKRKAFGIKLSIDMRAEISRYIKEKE